MDTLIVNLYGGPGTGKSSMATGIFSKLKFKNVNCEYVPEFAKDLVWENRTNALDNQLYVTAKQYHRIQRLIGKVKVVITDSPILLGAIYSGDYYLGELVKSLHANLDTYDIFLNRKKKYNPEGRYQCEGDAIELDSIIYNLITRSEVLHISDEFDIPKKYDTLKLFEEFDALESSMDTIVDNIIELIGDVND